MRFFARCLKILLSIYSRYAAGIVQGFQEFPMLLHYIPHPYVDANSILVSLVSVPGCRLLTEVQLLIARTMEMVGMRILLTRLLMVEFLLASERNKRETNRLLAQIE